MKSFFLLLIAHFCGVFTAYSQFIEYKPRFQAKAKGGIELIGNTLLKSKPLSTGSENPKAIMKGQILEWVDEDTDPSTFSSSAAYLDIPRNSRILWAGLYWHSYRTTPNQTARIRFPGMETYETISANQVGSNGYFYFAFSNITKYFSNTNIQNGYYWVANLDGANQLPDVTHCAWGIVVVYQNDSSECKNLSVIDGYKWVQYNNLDLSIANIRYQGASNQDAIFGTIAFEGDGGVASDYILFNKQKLNDSTGSENNIFNGSITSFGKKVGTGKPSYTNQLGIDVDKFYVGSLLKPNDSTISIVYGVNNSPDWYFPTVFTLEAKSNVLYSNLQPNPTITICKGQEAKLQINAPPGGAVQYVWNGPNTYNVVTSKPELTLQIETSGTFTVSIIGASECQISTTVSVALFEGVKLGTSPSYSVCKGQSVKLQTRVAYGQGTFTYIWSGPGVQNVTTSTPELIVNPKFSTNYTLTVIDSRGCSDQQQIPVFVSDTNFTTQYEWKNWGNVGLGRHKFHAKYIGQGKILVIGGFINSTEAYTGFPTASCEIIDVNEKKVFPASSMNMPRADFVVLYDQDSSLIALGGVTISTNIATEYVERFNSVDNAWKVIGKLLQARRQHASIFINKDEILVAGGRASNFSVLQKAEIFNVRTGMSRSIADLPFPMTDASLIQTSKGEILIFGGRSAGINSYREQNIYRYDVDSNRWFKHGTLDKKINYCATIKISSGKYVVSGGAITEMPANFAQEVYLEENGKLRVANSLLKGRSAHTMAEVESNKVIVIGGSNQFINGNAFKTDSLTEFIDFSNDSRSPGPTLNTARAMFATVEVPTGVGSQKLVFAISGINDVLRANTPSIEILDKGCALCSYQIATNKNGTLCKGESIVLTAPSGFAYQWSNGETTQTITVFARGKYSVKIIDEAGCYSYSNIDIEEVHPQLIYDELVEKIVSVNESIDITLPIRNTSTASVQILNPRLAVGKLFSLSNGQPVLMVEPSSSAILNVRFTGASSSSYTDTLFFFDDCGTQHSIVLRMNVSPTSVENYLFGNNNNIATVRLFPQPANESVTFEFTHSKVVIEALSSVKLYDMLGQEYDATIQRNLDFATGDNTISSYKLSTRNLLNGQYILKFQYEGFSAGIRFIVFR